MILRIFRDSEIAQYRQAVEVDAQRVDVYRTEDEFPFIDEDMLLPTLIEVPVNPPELVRLPEGANDRQRAPTDIENAIRMHAYLRDLSRTQAADRRLWTTLSHTTFWHYTRSRWPLSTDDEKSRSLILRRWFVPSGTSKALLARQAISRLWWAAHLTWAPWLQDPILKDFEHSDPYRFTRILLRNQQFLVDTVERNYGSSLRLRICLLDALDRYLDKVGAKDKLSKGVGKRFNLVLGHVQLGVVPLHELRGVCERVVGEVARTL